MRARRYDKQVRWRTKREIVGNPTLWCLHDHPTAGWPEQVVVRHCSPAISYKGVAEGHDRMFAGHGLLTCVHIPKTSLQLRPQSSPAPFFFFFISSTPHNLCVKIFITFEIKLKYNYWIKNILISIQYNLKFIIKFKN